jgi:hypothetical protein
MVSATPGDPPKPSGRRRAVLADDDVLLREGAVLAYLDAR